MAKKQLKEAKVKKPKFYQVSDDAKEYILSFCKTLDADVYNGITFIGNSKLKKVIGIKKVSDDVAFDTGLLLIIHINEDLLNAIMSDDSAVKICIEDEVSKIAYDIESGRISLDGKCFSAKEFLIKRYGIDDVKRAKDLQAAALEQLTEKEKENNVEEI